MNLAWEVSWGQFRIDNLMHVDDFENGVSRCDSYLRMPAGVFICNFSKISKTNNNIKTSFTRLAKLVDITIFFGSTLQYTNIKTPRFLYKMSHVEWKMGSFGTKIDEKEPKKIVISTSLESRAKDVLILLLVLEIYEKSHMKILAGIPR